MSNKFSGFIAAAAIAASIAVSIASFARSSAA
jgi:hypothetical protein